MTKAEEILQTAAEVMKQRGTLRDKGEERSMERTVRVFNALTGRGITDVEGWTFMVILKLCREHTGHDMDNWIDATAYMALAAEAAVDTPPKPW